MSRQMMYRSHTCRSWSLEWSVSDGSVIKAFAWQWRLGNTVASGVGQDHSTVDSGVGQ